MAFNFREHSLFRVRKTDGHDTIGVMVTHERESDTVGIKRYIRDSEVQGGSAAAVLEGFSETDLRTDKFTDIQWDWIGKAHDFAKLVQENADMKVPARRIHPDDFDHEVMRLLYKQFAVWFSLGQPEWTDKIFNM